MQKLTDLTIRSLSPGTHWDSHTRGLGIRIGKQSRTFICLVRSGRRKTVGRFPYLSLSAARKLCVKLKAEVVLGRIDLKRIAWQDAVAEYGARGARGGEQEASARKCGTGSNSTRRGVYRGQVSKHFNPEDHEAVQRQINNALATLKSKGWLRQDSRGEPYFAVEPSATTAPAAEAESLEPEPAADEETEPKDALTEA